MHVPHTFLSSFFSTKCLSEISKARHRHSEGLQSRPPLPSATLSSHTCQSFVFLSFSFFLSVLGCYAFLPLRHRFFSFTVMERQNRFEKMLQRVVTGHGHHGEHAHVSTILPSQSHPAFLQKCSVFLLFLLPSFLPLPSVPKKKMLGCF